MTSSSDGAFYEALVTSDPDTFAKALTAARTGMWWYDVGKDEMHYSGFLRESMGLGDDEFLSRLDAMHRLVHPDDLRATMDGADAHMAEGTVYETAHRMRQADGRYAVRMTNAVPVHDESGTLTRAIGIIRSQDELELSRSRLLRAEIAAGLGHLTLNVDTGEITWSDGLWILQGLEPGSVVLDRGFTQSRYVAEDIDEVRRVVTDAAERGIGFEYRARFVHANGALRHVKVVGEVDTIVDGRGVTYSAVVQDITDEVRRQSEVRQSQKMEALGTMTGGAAHDFNNLLAVVLGNLELLREGVTDPDLLAYCDSAISAALNGASLTKSMLAFARQAQLNPETIDVNSVVRGVAQWAIRTLPERIETEISLLAGLWKIDVDAASLESALLNVILNARDAMPDGGRLTIETSNVRIDDDYIERRREDLRPGRHVLVAISDTGRGIAPEHLESVFEPFFTTKAIGEGTGLGLSMVQGFVKQSSGTVQIYSEPGVGTTVKLYFPTSKADLGGHRETEPHENVANSSGERILLAEDDPDVLAVLVEILSRSGFDVRATGSGDEALAAFLSDPTFDLLVTDIVMPGDLQGTALARRLRGIRPDLPVVFMSGYANEATVHGNGLRPEDIRLMKPVRTADILAAVRKALE